MNILKINTAPAFGKKPVMTCTVLSESDKKLIDATLYKLDTNNPQDVNDVYHSKTAQEINDDVYTAFVSGKNNHTYYLLQNDKTKEVISCAKTSHHYRNFDAPNPGLSTVIEKFAENKKYINAGEPTIAYIVLKAKDECDRTVYSVDIPSKIPEAVNSANFINTNYEGISYLPSKSFNNFLDRAENRFNICYLA